MVFGVQDFAVSSDVPAEAFRWTRSFSTQTGLMPSAMALLPTSVTTSTPRWSNHWRTVLMPTSGLFWWSAVMISILMSGFCAVNSSTACLTQATEVGPVTSR